MGGYYWYSDNPNCGRCGHLNSRGFCNMTACIYPIVPQTKVIQKPRTNADRIRSMTDEELAEFLWTYGGIGICPPIKCTSKKCGAEKCWLDWLKREATE